MQNRPSTLSLIKHEHRTSYSVLGLLPVCCSSAAGTGNGGSFVGAGGAQGTLSIARTTDAPETYPYTTGAALPSDGATTDFGPNGLTLIPQWISQAIQNETNTIFNQQIKAQFGLCCYAYLFQAR